MEKTLQQLTFKDNFMFAAVMMDSEIARGVLERILGIEIDHVEVTYEKSIIYNPEYKGIRLDVFLKDENGTRFDVEMQVASEKILKRARYYHNQIDMDILLTGVEYEELPDTYVIFICDFDPFGLGKYKYTKKQVLEENPTFKWEDGEHTVFLNTKGTNEDEVPESLVKFLKYVSAGTEDETDYEDEFIRRLQKSVERIKLDREMGRRYMLFEELLKKEYKAGKVEGKIEGKIESTSEMIFDFLKEVAPISDELSSRITAIDDLNVLTVLCKRAAKIKSIEEFEEILREQGF